MRISKSQVAGTALLIVLNFVFALAAAPAHGVDDGNPIPVDKRQFVLDNPGWPGGQLPPPDPYRAWMGMVFTGGGNPVTGLPFISASSSKQSSSGQWISQSHLCQPDLQCLTGDFRTLMANGVLDFCEKTKASPCVEGLDYRLGEEPFRPAEYLFTADPSPTAAFIDEFMRSSPTSKVLRDFGWQGAPGIPDSASGPHIYRLPGAINSAGTDMYSLAPAFTFVGDPQGTIKPSISDFNVAITPVAQNKSKSSQMIVDQRADPFGLDHVNLAVVNDVAYHDRHSVGYAAQFPNNLELRVSIRIDKSIGGWYQGRVLEPDVSQTSINENDVVLKISAKPTLVPTTYAGFDAGDPASQKFISFVRFPSSEQSLKDYSEADATGNGWKYSRYTAWNTSFGTEVVSQLSELLGNKSKGYGSVWDFRKMQVGAPCMTDNSSFQGLLVTNAMTYQANLPTFENAQLTYRVAGLHYDSSGKVFQGNYYFIMRDTVARCLYGFKGSAPISGTVNVTSSDGQENVAYTNVTDRDGWLKLTAQGFTFSSPVISAKLTQAPDPAPTPTVTPAPVIVPTAAATPTTTPTGPAIPLVSPTAGETGKKSTITCVKGKVVRVMTGSHPKCPFGFKKKN